MTRADAGPLLAAGAVVAGIVAGEWMGPSAATALLLGGVVLAVAALGLRSGPVALCALVVLGGASMQRALHGLVDSPLSGAVEARSRAVVHGELVIDPKVYPYSVRVRVRVHDAEIDGRPVGVDRILLVRAGGDVAMRLGVLDAGDGVTLAGALEPLDGWDSRERWNHAVGLLRADELVSFAPPDDPLGRVANRLRRRVVAGLASLPATERALASSFLLGDDRALPTETVEEFRAAGMTHLLVVSGSNVAFALALCAPILRWLGLRPRFLAGIGVLLVFGTMTRWEPSVLRAVVMAAIVMTGVLLGRPSRGLRVLALAVTALLLVDPFLVHSVAFLLSCGATGGIAALAAPFAARLRGPRWWRDVFATTVAAELGVAPVLVAVFGSVPLVALPANVAAVPPAGMITIGGLAVGVGGGLARPWMPEIADLVTVPVGALLTYERAVAALAARVPIELTAAPAVLLAALVALAAVVGRARRLPA